MFIAVHAAAFQLQQLNCHTYERTMSVGKAVELAQQAVAADHGRKYEEAVRLYSSALTEIEFCLQNHRLEDSNRVGLERFKSSYQDRLAVLQEFVATSAKPAPRNPTSSSGTSPSSTSTGRSSNVNSAVPPTHQLTQAHVVKDDPLPPSTHSPTSTGLSDRIPVPSSSSTVRDRSESVSGVSTYQFVQNLLQVSTQVPESAPASIHQKCFWLMRILRESIRRGITLSDSLTIPREVWYQQHIRIAAYETKLATLKAALEHVRRLQNTEVSNTKELTRLVSIFAGHTDQLQETLSKQLECVPIPLNLQQKKPESLGERLRMFGSSIARSAQQMIASQEVILNTRTYADILYAFFDESQFIGDWIAHYEQFSASPILSALHDISQFFRQAILTFVLTDLSVLLDRYMFANLQPLQLSRLPSFKEAIRKTTPS